MSDILTKQTKIVVWQNDNFKVTTPSIPHICKQDGGHLIVSPQKNISSITQLSDDLLLQMYKIVAQCELALISVLAVEGIEIPFTNNQDNGNWAVFNNLPKSLHVHIYGRAKNSKKQVFGEALYCPNPNSRFYDSNQPLTPQNIEDIKNHIINNINNS